MRVFDSVARPRTFTIPPTSMSTAASVSSSAAPSASSPTTPTARTLTPSAARFWAAFPAPPALSSLRSYRTISTGASRLMRSVSP